MTLRSPLRWIISVSLRILYIYTEREGELRHKTIYIEREGERYIGLAAPASGELRHKTIYIYI